jgi:hypothetical protein
VIHIYEIEGHGIYWEVWKQDPITPHNDDLILSIYTREDYEWYLDILRSDGVDFVIHTLEEYDEYHIALPSV